MAWTGTWKCSEALEELGGSVWPSLTHTASLGLFLSSCLSTAGKMPWGSWGKGYGNWQEISLGRKNVEAKLEKTQIIQRSEKKEINHS